MTFADLMSLLMGFFVLLISFSSFDEVEFQAVSHGLQASFPRPAAQGAVRRVRLHPPAAQTSVLALVPAPTLADAARAALLALSDSSRAPLTARVTETSRGVEVSVPADRVFEPLSDRLTRGSFGLFVALAELARAVEPAYRVRVEVARPDVPRPAPQFEDTLALAMSRALAAKASLDFSMALTYRSTEASVLAADEPTSLPDVTFLFEPVGGGSR